MWSALSAGLATAANTACATQVLSPSSVLLTVALVLTAGTLVGLLCCCCGCGLGALLALVLTGHPASQRFAQAAAAAAVVAWRPDVFGVVQSRPGLARLAGYRPQ